MDMNYVLDSLWHKTEKAQDYNQLFTTWQRVRSKEASPNLTHQLQATCLWCHVNPPTLWYDGPSSFCAWSYQPAFVLLPIFLCIWSYYTIPFPPASWWCKNHLGVLKMETLNWDSSPQVGLLFGLQTVMNQSNTIPTAARSEGNLVLLTQNGTVVWLANSTTKASTTIVQLLDSGNLILRNEEDQNPQSSWQSFEYPSNTVLPGMKIGWDLKSGLNRHITAWNNWDDPTLGNFTWEILLHNYVPTGSLYAWANRVFQGRPKERHSIQ